MDELLSISLRNLQNEWRPDIIEPLIIMLRSEMDPKYDPILTKLLRNGHMHHGGNSLNHILSEINVLFRSSRNMNHHRVKMLILANLKKYVEAYENLLTSFKNIENVLETEKSSENGSPVFSMRSSREKRKRDDNSDDPYRKRFKDTPPSTKDQIALWKPSFRKKVRRMEKTEDVAHVLTKTTAWDDFKDYLKQNDIDMDHRLRAKRKNIFSVLEAILREMNGKVVISDLNEETGRTGYQGWTIMPIEEVTRRRFLRSHQPENLNRRKIGPILSDVVSINEKDEDDEDEDDEDEDDGDGDDEEFTLFDENEDEDENEPRGITIY